MDNQNQTSDKENELTLELNILSNPKTDAGTSEGYTSTKDEELKKIPEALDLDQIYINTRLREAEGSLQNVTRQFVIDHKDDLEEIGLQAFFDEGYNEMLNTSMENNLTRVKRYIKKAAMAVGVAIPKWTSTRSSSDDIDDMPVKEYKREEGSKELNQILDLCHSASEDIDSLEAIVKTKFDTIYKLVYNTAIGKSDKDFAIICGSAGCGKTFTVNQAVEKAIPHLSSQKVQVKKVYGSIGASATSLCIFLWEHRAKYLLVMDDADGFLTEPKVANYLKAALEEHPVTFPSTILNMVNRQRNAKSKRESTLIQVDRNKLLRERILSISINGQKLEEYVNEDEYNTLLKTFKFQDHPIRERRNNKIAYLTGYGTKLYERDEDDEDEDNDEELERELAEAQNFVDTSNEIPDAFLFESKFIFVSNLKLIDIDEAVRSRMNKYELTLTPQEFLCQLRFILPGIRVKGNFTNEEKEWAKKQAYSLLAVALEAREKGATFNGQAVALGQNILQFRIIPTLTSALLNLIEDYALEHKIKDRNKALMGVIPSYVKFRLLPELRGDTRR
jgi:hypothetical protein